MVHSKVDVFTWIILGVIVALHILDAVASSLNLDLLRKTSREAFHGIYGEENRRKLIGYSSINERIGVPLVKSVCLLIG